MDDLRAAFAHMTPDEIVSASRERELNEWTETNRFCGRCGHPMQRHPDSAETAYVCPACTYRAYPAIAPAVIVLVRKGDRILLQRNAHYRLKNWTLVAGFVDPGETLEQAVRREVREEASVEVTNIRYFGSQPWPFPSNLMIAFTADWASGELTCDGDEVVASDWFTREALPEIPQPGSIARALIDVWLDGQTK